MLCIISPPLGKIRPRIENLITMVGRENFDVEDVAHGVLVVWDVDLVGVFVVAFEHLERSIRSWPKFGLAFVGEALLAKVDPHKISDVEHHGVRVDVELGRKSLYLALDVVPCILMHLLEMVHTCTCIHIDTHLPVVECLARL